jgi:xanthomonalisin
LYLNSDASRASEQVWNENGASDMIGYNFGPMGATGGGCSTMVAARNFQKYVTGYSTLGCGAQRSAADIAAIADPYTGFDMLSTYNFGSGAPGWQTIGGTSLASPVVAAMWALVGGAQNISYPALTLYGHFKSAPATYDVQVGGNGACDTANPTACKAFYGGSQTANQYWGYNVDCAYSPNDTTNTGQCYAQKGFDGPSGVGAPRGLSTFTAMAPKASVTGPSSVAHGTSATFTGTATDPFPGGSISSYSWTFGDGGTATGATAHHTFAHAGTYTVTVRATDAYGVLGTASRTVTVT